MTEPEEVCLRSSDAAPVPSAGWLPGESCRVVRDCPGLADAAVAGGAFCFWPLPHSR